MQLTHLITNLRRLKKRRSEIPVKPPHWEELNQYLLADSRHSTVSLALKTEQAGWPEEETEYQE